MKKILTMLLAVVMCFVVFGCGQGNEKKVANLNGQGEKKTESLNRQDAEKKYMSLKKEVVEEMQKLKDARPTYAYDPNWRTKEQIEGMKKYVVQAEIFEKNVPPKLEEMRRLANQGPEKLGTDYTRLSIAVVDASGPVPVERFKQKIEYQEKKNAKKKF